MAAAAAASRERKCAAWRNMWQILKWRKCGGGSGNISAVA